MSEEEAPVLVEPALARAACRARFDKRVKQRERIQRRDAFNSTV